jgi:hypothetical protein
VNLTGNDALTDLHGLDHLTRIGGALTIDFDVALAALDGLAARVQVDGAIDVRGVAVPADQIAAFKARFAH